MFTHIAKDWRIVKLPDQAKNAIDSTIKNNDNIKKKIKQERNEYIGETVDRNLYEIKWAWISMGRIPRHK